MDLSVFRFENINLDRYKDMITNPCHCTRCGNKSVYSEAKLPKYLTEFQLLSGQNSIPFPIKLSYKHRVDRVENKEGGFFKKENIEVKYGDVHLILSFKDEMSKEDLTKWQAIFASKLNLIFKGEFKMIMNINPVKCVFVSAPFTGTAEEQAYRHGEITQYVGMLMRKGIQAYSPVTFGYAVASVASLPTDFRFWEAHCNFFINACTEVHVLKLKGWKESIGVDAELKLASKLGKRVEFI